MAERPKPTANAPKQTKPDLAARIDQMKAALWGPADANSVRSVKNLAGAIQTTLAVLAYAYGANSPQLRAFQERLRRGYGERDNIHGKYERRMAEDIEDTVAGALSDMAAGVGGSTHLRVKGELLGDFVGLAHAALDRDAEESNRVAAVLTAAALEETLKALGLEANLDVYDRDMRAVIEKLKSAGILVGAQFSLAHGYVKFRDSAFHGQFDQIARSTTESALVFVEGLLASSFS